MNIPAFIDVEASGFGAGSYPIEVGFVLESGKCFCSLIRPESGWTHWDLNAEKIHKIKRDQLLQHGRYVTDIAGYLNLHLRDLDVYTDAWGHDSAWINRIFDATGILQRFRIRDLRELCTQEQLGLWDQTKEQVMAQLALQRHRASSDALVLQATYHEIMQTGQHTGRVCKG